jgi:serine/alanine racemase
MYLLLPSVMFFLFSFLMSFRGKRLRRARDISLIVYLIHPVFIVVTRFAASIVNLEKLFVENETVMFITVTLLSFIFSFVCLFMFNKLKKKSPKSMSVSPIRFLFLSSPTQLSPPPLLFSSAAQ